MTEFVNFCREYGLYILHVLSLIIGVIFIIIKRKPKTVDDFLYCLNEIRLLVPQVVNEVECPGNGESKKAAVIECLINLFEKTLGRKTTEKEKEIAANLLSSDIEVVLSTPQKKENNNEK